MSKSCLMGTVRVPLIHKQLCVWWAGIQYNSILKDKDYSETVIQLQMESKILTVLKSTKLLHEHTIYLLIYVHACILHSSRCKKARCCERNVDVCMVVIGLKDVGKIEPNLRVHVQIILYLTYTGKISTRVKHMLNMCGYFSCIVYQHNSLFRGYHIYIVQWDCHTAIHLKHPTFLGITYPSWIN